MSRNFFRLTLSAGVLFTLANAAAAGLVTIADWQFGQGAAFLQDSGPHGYNLQNNGTVSQGHDGSPSGNEPASGNFAQFPGGTGNNLQTTSPIAVSGYSELVLTWSMQYASPTNTQSFVFETTTNSNANAGALYVDVSEPAGFAAPSGLAGFTISPSGNSDLVNYSHASGTSDVWDNYKVVFDTSGTTNTTSVQVYKNGVSVVNPGLPYGSSSTSGPAGSGFSFLDALAYIGGRTGDHDFVGNIGEIKLQGVVPDVVPEPSSLVLLGCACAAVLVRGRKRLTALAAARLGR